jgi:hypothetical protein
MTTILSLFVGAIWRTNLKTTKDRNIDQGSIHSRLVGQWQLVGEDTGQWIPPDSECIFPWTVFPWNSFGPHYSSTPWEADKGS